MENLNRLSDKEQLFRILTFIAPLSEGLTRRFDQCISSKRYPKRHLLLSEGAISKHVYFICEGSARAFYHDRQGREHTTWFMTQNDLMISVYSFYKQLPAPESIELLEDSTILSMSWEDLQGVYADFPEYNYHGRLFTEQYYIRSEERLILLRTKDPAERYHLLLKNQPGLLQKASLGQIASFLEITPETLSRIRSRKEI